MTRIRIAAIATLATAAALAAHGLEARSAAAADEAAIRRTIQFYFGGGATVRQAFDPVAQMTYVTDSGLAVVPIEQYIARSEAAAKAGRPSPWSDQRIASIDITGDAAVAKLQLQGANGVVTDYMTLLEIDGEWKIVNKSFTRKQ